MFYIVLIVQCRGAHLKRIRCRLLKCGELGQASERALSFHAEPFLLTKSGRRDACSDLCYVELVLDNATLSLSPEHYINANGRLVYAKDVKINDVLAYVDAT